jgi:hypothetical protein
MIGGDYVLFRHQMGRAAAAHRGNVHVAFIEGMPTLPTLIQDFLQIRLAQNPQTSARQFCRTTLL